MRTVSVNEWNPCVHAKIQSGVPDARDSVTSVPTASPMTSTVGSAQERTTLTPAGYYERTPDVSTVSSRTQPTTEIARCSWKSADEWTSSTQKTASSSTQRTNRGHGRYWDSPPFRHAPPKPEAGLAQQWQQHSDGTDQYTQSSNLATTPPNGPCPAIITTTHLPAESQQISHFAISPVAHSAGQRATIPNSDFLNLSLWTFLSSPELHLEISLTGFCLHTNRRNPRSPI